MRISTTINYCISPCKESAEGCASELKRYKAIGFDCLDAIMCGAADADSPLRQKDWRGWAHRVADAAAEVGITIVQSHVPMHNFCTRPEGTPEDLDEMVDRAIEAAAIFGAPWTVAHPATALGEGRSMNASRGKNIEFFSKRLETAAKFGIGIALENMADFEGGGRRRWYCAEVEELCDLIDTLDQGTGLVGACWDFGHANLVYPSQREALLYLGQRLKVTHTHDNSGLRDEHLAPFRGNVDFFEIMKTLKEMDYRHDLSFEVKRMLNPRVPESLKDNLWRHLLDVGRFLVSLYEDK